MPGNNKSKDIYRTQTQERRRDNSEKMLQVINTGANRRMFLGKLFECVFVYKRTLLSPATIHPPAQLTHLFRVIIYNPLVSGLGNLFPAHMREFSL